MFPITTFAWRRMKLLIAELLILSVYKGEHSIVYAADVFEAAGKIREFRDHYYPRGARL